MGSSNYTKTQDALPEEGLIVETVTESGFVSDLKRQGRLWFLPNGSMYVYYNPIMWRKK